MTVLFLTSERSGQRYFRRATILRDSEPNRVPVSNDDERGTVSVTQAVERSKPSRGTLAYSLLQ